MFGLGIGLLYKIDDAASVRARISATGKTKLQPKESDRSGALETYRT